MSDESSEWTEVWWNVLALSDLRRVYFDIADETVDNTTVKIGILVGTFTRPNEKLVRNHFVAYKLNFEEMTALVVDSYGRKLQDINNFLIFSVESGFNVDSRFLGTQPDSNSCGIYAAQYAI